MNKSSLFLAWVLLIVSLSACPSDYELPNLEAGSAIFNINSKSNLITTASYQHIFASPFTAVPSIAYSIQFLGINTSAITQWSVKTNSITNNKLSIAFKHQPLYWSILKVGFWASARPDILVGAVTADFSNLKQAIAPVYVNFSTPIPNFNVSIARAFLSGFTMKSGGQIYIRAFDKAISANRIQLGVQVGGSMQITSAQVNYIVFSPRTANFASYGGGVNQINLNQSKLYNIQKIVHHSYYRFYGIANLRQPSQTQTLLFTQIDDQFYLRVDNLKTTQQVYISYIIIGVTPSQSCSKCKQQQIINGVQCVSSCPSGSYLMNYKDGGKGCRKCSKDYNMVVNDAGNGCVCRRGYDERRGFCVAVDDQVQDNGFEGWNGAQLGLNGNKDQGNAGSSTSVTTSTATTTGTSTSQVVGVTNAIREGNSQIFIPASQPKTITNTPPSSPSSGVVNTNMKPIAIQTSNSNPSSSQISNQPLNNVISPSSSSSSSSTQSSQSSTQSSQSSQSYIPNIVQPQPQAQPQTPININNNSNNNNNIYYGAAATTSTTTSTQQSSAQLQSQSYIPPSLSPPLSPPSSPSPPSPSPSTSYEQIRQKMLQNRPYMAATVAVPSRPATITMNNNNKIPTTTVSITQPQSTQSYIPPPPPSTSQSYSNTYGAQSNTVKVQPIQATTTTTVGRPNMNNMNSINNRYNNNNTFIPGSNLNNNNNNNNNNNMYDNNSNRIIPSISAQVSVSTQYQYNTNTNSNSNVYGNVQNTPNIRVVPVVNTNTNVVTSSSNSNNIVQPQYINNNNRQVDQQSYVPVYPSNNNNNYVNGNTNNNYVNTNTNSNNNNNNNNNYDNSYVPTVPNTNTNSYANTNTNNNYNTVNNNIITSQQQQQSYIPTPPPSSSPSSPSPSPSSSYIPPSSSSPSSSSSSSSYTSAPPSYTPTPPQYTAPPASASSPPSYPMPMPNRDCSSFANTYWTGYRCSCRVGYYSLQNQCIKSTINKNNLHRPAQFIYKISYLYNSSSNNNSNSRCAGQNQQHNGMECVCRRGCIRVRDRCVFGNDNNGYNNYNNDNDNGYNNNGNINNNNSNNRNCPTNSYYSNSSQCCICVSPYTMINNQCISPISNQCGPYSQPNPHNPSQCTCQLGYNKHDGITCSQCPANQLYINNKCTSICGINQIYNPATTTCECQSNYGIYQQQCQVCPSGYHIYSGFCVMCPLYAQYSSVQGRCVCVDGYTDRYINGMNVCISRCNVNQKYDSSTKICRCRQGLARIYTSGNSICGLCTDGYVQPISQTCITQCRINQYKPTINSRCICKQGYGYGPNNQCILCQSLQNVYLSNNGYCITCASNMVYINNICTCGTGMRMLDGRCVPACRQQQIMDNRGYCYSCPIYEINVNQMCVCTQGYVRVNGVCRLDCGDGKIQINGICGVCVMGTVYDISSRSCLCPKGTYMGAYGQCQVYVPVTPTCLQSQYYSQSTRRCQSCPSSCRSCTDLSTCTRCNQDGLYVQSGACVSRCGDGIMVANQRCDDGNVMNGDGCNMCQLENGYQCTGTRPTVCTIMGYCGDGIVNGNQQCDDRNYMRNDGCYNCIKEIGWECNSQGCYRINNPRNPTPTPTPMPPNNNTPTPTPTPVPTPTPQPVTPVIDQYNLKVVGQAFINQNNVFVILETPKGYKFQSDSQMKSFMKYRFTDSGTQPSSAYCMQRATNLKIFECLIIYASGVPNRKFTINFSYDYQGDNGYTTAPIDPFKSILRTRSLK